MDEYTFKLAILVFNVFAADAVAIIVVEVFVKSLLKRPESKI